MDYPTDRPEDVHSRHFQEFEDPHYHDADDVEGFDDPGPRETTTNLRRGQPARRLPLPPRRHYED